MKNLIKNLCLVVIMGFISFSSMVNVGIAQTSVYHPFPDSNAVWNVRRTSTPPFSCPPFPYLEEIFSYTFTGDTIINSRAYHQLFIPFVQKTDTCNNWHRNPRYAGSIRQDTSTKKVFIVFPDSISEDLLYDFSLRAGDTARFIAILGGYNSAINYIDSLLVGSEYRKVWHIDQAFTFTDTIKIIEGIGYESGPLSIHTDGDDGDFWDLTCFQQNGLNLYHPDTAMMCNVIASVTDLLEPDNTVTVFPNPTTGNLNISINKNIKQGQVNFFNMMGEKIFSEPFEDKRKTINLNLPSGIYFIQITDGVENWLSKFIKE